MKRFAYEKLVAWKNKPDNLRKPLVLQGARQVGKTWLLKELGRNEFESVVYINFEEQRQLTALFEDDFDVERIFRSIELTSGTKPIPGKTLIIFDEIQSAKRGLLSLKYLQSNAPQYHITAAGSLLGISLHSDESFPVGKVDFIDIYPLSFEEFLVASGKEALVTTLQRKDWKLINVFHLKYVDLLRQYYFIGGMPEVVNSYIAHNDFSEVRRLQNDLLRSYDNDFSKHPPISIIPRLKMVWNSIPSQLGKENKKFVYNAVKQGSRAKDFELAIEWLCEAGAIYKIFRTTNPSIPLKAFEDIDAFKLYLIDVGLLGAISGLEAKTIIDKNRVFGQFKGSLTEQFVLQQLLMNEEIKINFWTPKTGIAEVDFVIQLNGKIIPIEVKAEENLKAKSLKSYIEKYNPDISIRTSMSNYRVEEKLTNLPLYAIGLLKHFI